MSSEILTESQKKKKALTWSLYFWTDLSRVLISVNSSGIKSLKIKIKCYFCRILHYTVHNVKKVFQKTKLLKLIIQSLVQKHGISKIN
jgi:hypothetical protein